MSKRSHKAAFHGQMRRPIDKGQIVINLLMGINQSAVTLFEATAPCTVTGLYADLNWHGTTAVTTTAAWAVIILREGVVLPTMSHVNATNFMEPEQDIILSGSLLGNSNTVFSQQFSTKAMRKLKGGDGIFFIHKGISDTNTISLFGHVRFFCKF